MALGDYNAQYIHRKYGKLFYDIAGDLDYDEDLIIDANGAPDATQNPNAVFIGATDAGYEFSAEPTITEEEIDEAETPISAEVETVVPQITFDSLEVTDLERQAALIPFANYSENTVVAQLTKRITAGGVSFSLPTRPVCVISPEKTGGFLYVILWSAYNNGPHQLQFKRRERAKQSMTIRGLSVAARDDGDRVYRVGFQVPNVAIDTATPVTPGGTNGVAYTKTFEASGGVGPYTWLVVTGALPTGLTLSPAGVLSGTPSAAGTFNYGLKATDAYGTFGTKAMSQTVA